MKFLHSLILTAILSIAVFGCRMGPDYSRPTTAADTGSFVRIPVDWIDPNDPEAVGPWWKSFNDPLLDELIAEALAENHDIQSAAAAVMESQALLDSAFGARLPSANYSASRTRAKSVSLFPGFESEPMTSYSQELSISYIVDVFGRLRRAERAARDDLAAATETERTVVHSIIATVVRTRVSIATQQRLLEVARRNVDSRKNTLSVVERRYRQGLLSPVDIYLARENIASVQSQVPQLEQGILLASNGLDVLTGRRPGTHQELPATLAEMPELSPIPVGLPAALLDRRPDVRVAERRLAAATERVGVNIAAMYPDLSLTAAGGYQSDSFRMLTASENQVYAAVMGLTAPIFRGGQLKAQVDAAEARVKRLAAEYAKTVLTAMREVEDALVRCEKLSDRLVSLQIRLAEASRARQLALDRYSQGVDSILTVLETERRHILAETELVTTRGDLYNARIDLYLALGGDWLQAATRHPADVTGTARPPENPSPRILSLDTKPTIDQE
ncbi:MAG: efflux transporter outer membrane subunit [Phycisphaerae bacterium]|nr:efflux transporter outer membrane subunit [Phycisphaerae bacterium]